jgi:hypothetical protein
MSDRAKSLARQIFRKLAEAEAESHGLPVERIHFHEVGALDSIADILGAAVGIDALGIEIFTSRSVVVGNGTVNCAHGVMPVPAPATAFLLRGAPMAAAPPGVRGELTTPTGAAILATVVTRYVESPEMVVERIGHGAGSKDFLDHSNVLRLFLGTAPTLAVQTLTDSIWILETNLDDVPGEIIGYTLERLLEAGARDAYLVPIQMKKSRPGQLLTVLTDLEHRDNLERILFRETGTFGVRRREAMRTIREREAITIETPWGPVAAKRGTLGSETIVTPEYADCARLARTANVPLRAIYAAIHHPMPR